MLKKMLIIFLLTGMIAPFPMETRAAEQPKNVIFMVMDGTNSDVITLSRWYKGEALALDSILVGGVKTKSLKSAITDSAAAGTAMATGQKTTIDFIGMVPARDDDGVVRGRPVANILEAAQDKGLATGIVATSPIQHATPAAFSAHSVSRHRYEDIAMQQLHQGIDVILGGGRDYTEAVKKSKKLGLLTTRAELLNANGTQLHGNFAPIDMAYDFDRKKLHPDQPSLQEMTRKAINVLAKKPNGFFLFVEGSKVDFAAHKNDPVGMISEVLAFDKAVSEALNFAKDNGNTLLIVTTDHGNSGLTMGNKNTEGSYAETPADVFIKPIKKARLTVTGATSQLKEDRSNIKSVLSSYGLDHLSKKQLKKLKKAEDFRSGNGADDGQPCAARFYYERSYR